MRLHVQISTRFLIVGVIGVIATAVATSAGFIWQELLTHRVAQRSHLSAVALAGQTELEKQRLPNAMLAGATELPAGATNQLVMRIRSVNAPPAIEQLGVKAEIMGLADEKKGIASGMVHTEAFCADEDGVMASLAGPADTTYTDIVIGVFGGSAMAFGGGIDAMSGASFMGAPDWAMTGVPLRDAGGRIAGVLIVRQPLFQLRHVIGSSRMIVPLMGALAGAIPAAFGFFLLGRRLSQKSKSLQEGFRALRKGMLTHRQPVNGWDDLAALQHEFNLAMDDIQENDERKQSVILDFEKARKEAVVATAAKSDFLANMSHEIRTPMNGIIGTTSALMEMGLDSEQEELVHMIRSSGESLLHLINDILDFSKLESAKMDIENIPVDLDELMAETIDVFGFRAAEKGLEINYHVDPSMPRKFMGDFQRVKQILVNLGGNAIKFTPTGEILLMVRQVVRPSPGGGEMPFLHFSVRDTGIGIAQDKIHTLFEAFTQVDASTTRKYGGTGLGLAISRKLCRLMGGEISVSSEEGKGSDFFFEIPLRAAPDDSGRDEERGWMEVVSKQPVLFFTTHATTQQLLQQNLLKCGARSAAIQPDQDIAEVRQFLQQAAVFIIDNSGQPAEVLRGLTEMALQAGAAVIALAPLSNAQNRERYTPPSGSRYIRLSKPLKRRELLRCMAEAIRLPRHPQPAPLPLQQSTPVRQAPEASPTQQWSAPAAADRVPSTAGTHSSGAGAKESFASEHPARILLVEDQPLNQKITSMLMQRLGYGQIDIANNGREGVDMVNQGLYDVVFMDLQMPVMGGVDACREIRGNFLLKHQPAIIAMTGHALTGVKESCIEAGMDDFLTKPVSLDDFRRVIPECFENRARVSTVMRA